MTLKRLVIGFALVFLAALAWRLRLLDVLTGLASPARPAPVQIKFDNGSVRDTTPTVKVDPKSLPAPIGVLRKCLHGQQVSYTNSFCPPGTHEAPLSSEANLPTRASQRQSTSRFPNHLASNILVTPALAVSTMSRRCDRLLPMPQDSASDSPARRRCCRSAAGWTWTLRSSWRCTCARRRRR
jgi:hypothetical protein